MLDVVSYLSGRVWRRYIGGVGGFGLGLGRGVGLILWVNAFMLLFFLPAGHSATRNAKIGQ